MDHLVNKLVKVRSRLKSLEKVLVSELLYINTVLLSVQACVRMEAIQADDEDTRSPSSDDLTETKNLERSSDLERYNDLCTSPDRRVEASGEN